MHEESRWRSWAPVSLERLARVSFGIKEAVVLCLCLHCFERLVKCALPDGNLFHRTVGHGASVRSGTAKVFTILTGRRTVFGAIAGLLTVA